MYVQKKALAVHDISCIGRCSLTVALPIMSAAGIETSVLPTAMLSTHTGGFTGYTFADFTQNLPPITEHWKTLNRQFDCIYSGYLGSEEQISIVEGLFKDFSKEGCIKLVDPVMADNGKFYSIFNEDFAKRMASLCSQADIIIPNITARTITHHTGAVSHNNPSELGLYQNEHSEHLLFFAFVHCES